MIAGRWINGVVTLTFALDVDPLDEEAKEEAVSELLTEITGALPEDLAQNCVGSATWEEGFDDDRDCSVCLGLEPRCVNCRRRLVGMTEVPS